MTAVERKARAYGWPKIATRRPNRGAVAIAVESLGLLLVAVGVGLVYLPAGVIVAGLALVLVAQGVGR